MYHAPKCLVPLGLKQAASWEQPSSLLWMPLGGLVSELAEALAQELAAGWAQASAGLSAEIPLPVWALVLVNAHRCQRTKRPRMN